MGEPQKIVGVELTPSTVRLGGGFYGRLLRLAVREHASSRQTSRLLLEALVAAKLEAIPSDLVGFQVFAYGAVCAVLEPALGQHVADAVVSKIEHLLASSQSAPMGTPRDLALDVIVATSDDEVARTLLESFPDAVRARDFFSLLRAVEAQEHLGVNILLDGGLPGLSHGGRVTVARVLPPRARVVQWGSGDRPPTEALESAQWDCLPAPPDIELREIARALAHPPGVPLVLVVDDSESWRTVMTLMLTSEGYDVASAHNGLAGLAACVAHRPSVVLTDYEMPGMHGGQLARVIADRFGDRAPPVVILSSCEIERPVPGVCRNVLKTRARDELLPLLADLALGFAPE